MSKINYPAIFHKDGDGFWVEFPDLEGCFSSGKTLDEAFTNSKEALGLFLDSDDVLYQRSIKKPSTGEEICLKYPGELIMIIEYDSIEYAKKYKTKAIKKTLTIPEWLNDLALKQNINFSNILQEALMKKLNI